MSRTWKVVLIILAFSIVCVMAACAFLFVGVPILGETNTREPTREEWAKSPRGDGKYRIGNQAEMALGEWRTESNKYGCKWSRIQGFSTSSSITIENGYGDKIVKLDGRAQFFETRGCGTWYYQD